ncbi:hypothetical protein ACH5RR_033843 [Cinchona calisaya]|uniref:Uncharacterized protein n=1 Tax=Cinchona calisaya TaxID=153742 RepID=A0ABD2YDR6_9GENT
MEANKEIVSNHKAIQPGEGSKGDQIHKILSKADLVLSIKPKRVPEICKNGEPMNQGADSSGKDEFEELNNKTVRMEIEELELSKTRLVSKATSGRKFRRLS